jgi:hypothetical protein
MSRGAGTIGRISGLGGTAGLLALLLWPFFGGHEHQLVWPLGLLAALAGLCGAAILVITAFDIVFHRRRGRRIRPVRAFDIVLGLALVASSLLQLNQVLGQLPA